jgi:hypothetical protein
MDLERKPARIDVSQPEWTFSGEEQEEVLLLMQR